MLKSVFNLFISALLFSPIALAGPLFTGGVPALQGFTNETDTFITVMREPGKNYVYSFSPDVTTNVISNDVGHNHIIDTLEITNLKPGVNYQLLIKTPDGQVVDSRSFQSLDPNIENPKAAICSCARDGLLSPDDKQRSMFDRMMDQKPNIIFFLGDLVYGDTAIQAVLRYLSLKITKWLPNMPLYQPTFEKIQARYISSWKKEKIYRQAKMIPMYTIWDDHDFGFDGADKNNPYVDKILKLYRSYFPIAKESQVISRGPGASYSFNTFGKKVLMLDNRTFSSLSEGVLLGQEQLRWIESETIGQKEIIIASGMTIVSKGRKEKSLQRSAPSEWQQFRQIFFSNPDLRAVFFTGDVHYSEVRNIPENVLGFKTVQVTSSHMHSTSPLLTPPFSDGKNKRDLNQVNHVNGRNFAIVAMDNLFTQLHVVFHRDKNKPPVSFIGDTQNIRNQCAQFYRIAQ